MSARSRVGGFAVGLLGTLVVGVGAMIVWRVQQTAAVGHEGPEPRLGDADRAKVAAWFAGARDAASGVGDTPDGTGDHEAWVCRHTPPETSCATGRGDDFGEAVRAAVAGRAWAATGVLRIELLLAVSEGEFPDVPSPHQVGAVGLRVGDHTLSPSDTLTRGLFEPPREDDAPEWDLDAVAAALGQDTHGFPVQVLTTATYVQDAPGAEPRAVLRLHDDAWPDTSPAGLAEPIHLAEEHLLSLVAGDGRIRYRFDPRSGRELAGQNLLRHAGTTWALIRAGERTGDPRFTDASTRALQYLLRHTGTDTRQGPHGGGRVRFVVEGKHLKLGGAGLALVATAAHHKRTGDTQFDEPGRQFAAFLTSQQQESGEFWSFAPKVDGGSRKDDVSAYYPGEAVLGLATWYEVDPDPRWLATAVRGADWLLDVRDAGKGPAELDADHWLMMALERLHLLTGDDRYADHAVRLAETVALQQERQKDHTRFHRDYRGGFYEPPRSTPATIRAEGVGAVLDLCARTGRDCARFVPVLHDAVGHALLSQYGPEDTWWVSRPEAVIGGFAGGIVDPVLRNDYAQHAYCALLAAFRHPSPDVTDQR